MTVIMGHKVGYRRTIKFELETESLDSFLFLLMKPLKKEQPLTQKKTKIDGKNVGLGKGHG